MPESITMAHHTNLAYPWYFINEFLLAHFYTHMLSLGALSHRIAELNVVMENIGALN